MRPTLPAHTCLQPTKAKIVGSNKLSPTDASISDPAASLPPLSSPCQTAQQLYSRSRDRAPSAHPSAHRHPDTPSRQLPPSPRTRADVASRPRAQRTPKRAPAPCQTPRRACSRSPPKNKSRSRAAPALPAHAHVRTCGTATNVALRSSTVQPCTGARCRASGWIQLGDERDSVARNARSARTHRMTDVGGGVGPAPAAMPHAT
eukprot:79598-Chlamydomonas_euryale.AAC.1